MQHFVHQPVQQGVGNQGMDERVVVEQVLKGDVSAYKLIVDGYQNLVGHMVFRMVSNRSDREDLCQEVFVKAYENLRTFKFQCKLSTWLSKIAYNTCLNFLQKKKVPLYGEIQEHSLENDQKDLDGQFSESYWSSFSAVDLEAMKKESGSIVQNAIEALPPDYKAIVTLYHVDELSYEEIGEVLSIPAGTVKSHLFRARRLLKIKLLENYTAEELWS